MTVQTMVKPARAKARVDSAPKLDGPGLREIRETMHLPIRSLARWTDRAESTIRDMEAGKRAIPAEFAEWISGLGRWLADNAPPAKTR